MKRTIIVGEHIIKLDVCESTNVSKCRLNNIKGHSSQGNLSWTISELLEDYSNEKLLSYLEDLFFDVIDLGCNRVRCIGFYNHLEVDLDKLKIIRLINNK